MNPTMMGYNNAFQYISDLLLLIAAASVVTAVSSIVVAVLTTLIAVGVFDRPQSVYHADEGPPLDPVPPPPPRRFAPAGRVRR